MQVSGTWGPAGWGRRERRSRQDFAAPVRPRPVKTRVRSIVTHTSTIRTTLLAPKEGRRIRIHRIKLVQLTSEGTRECELYFGTARNLESAGDDAIDILRVANLSEAATRTWSAADGPLGERGQPLSHRWLTSPRRLSHKAIIQYSEEG